MSAVMRAEWRAVPGFEGFYEVSNLARVRSLDRSYICGCGRGLALRSFKGRILKQETTPNDYYYQCSLSKDGVQHQVLVQHLVAAAFLGPRPPGLLVLHKNGDGFNSRPGNLYYGTGSQNSDDARSHGTLAMGERHGCAKLTERDVKEIRRLRGIVAQRKLAKRYGVSQGTIGFISRGETWTHVR